MEYDPHVLVLWIRSEILPKLQNGSIGTEVKYKKDLPLAIKIESIEDGKIKLENLLSLIKREADKCQLKDIKTSEVE